MHLADHIRPLLRDHDCVIIPDFGGLVADVSSARAQPGRQVLSPPTKLVAFNQALTRNDGLLVDALSEHLGLPIAQAREAVRTAVASLQQELDETNRTELPGIGIFRRAVGRGLSFEYTGTDNLLAAAFGLPELAARPVRANNTRPERPQPALRGTATRRTRWARLLPGGIIALAAGLMLLANYQFAANAGYLPANWRTSMANQEWAQQRPVTISTIAEPQQATLGQHDFTSRSIESEGTTPLETAPPVPGSAAEATPLAAAAEMMTDAPSKPVVVAADEVPVKIKAAVGSPAARPLPAKSMNAKAAATTPVAPAVAKAPVAASSSSSTTIKVRTGRFYVIAGAYSSMKGAEQGRKVLVRTGHASHIILPPYGSRLFRLTAADYPDLASAQREAQRLRVTTHSDYNTLKF